MYDPDNSEEVEVPDETPDEIPEWDFSTLSPKTN